MKTAITIRSVDDLIHILDSKAVFGHRASGKRRNFGLWFRGQCCAAWKLQPSIFRSSLKMLKNEFSIMVDLQKRYPEYASSLSYFQILTFMQHYSVPTRLLDWTENAFIGLYFAIDDPKYDYCGSHLYILDGKALNSYAYGNDGIWIEEHFIADYIVQLSISKTVDEFLESFWSKMIPAKKVSIVHMLQGGQYVDLYKIAQRFGKTTKEYIETLESLAKSNLRTDDRLFVEMTRDLFNAPAAIMPTRTNDRIKRQHGTFTIHGSSRLVGKPITRPMLDKVGTLETVSKSAMTKAGPRILLTASIPKTSKRRIRRELELLGINMSVVFPEIDYQMKHFRRNWEKS